MKSKDKKFVGQPIFEQITNLIPRNKFFYFLLLDYLKPVLSVNELDKVSFDKLFIFDSTTIRLFSEVIKGDGRNPKGEGKKKGGL